jgi:hypothetical protein
LRRSSTIRGLSPAYRQRETVLRVFCEPQPGQPVELPQPSPAEWIPLLRWLDTSGLALYFLDRVTELELCDLLPQGVLAQLRQRLRENAARTEAMIAEATAIRRSFQSASLSYAVLKGFSLWPVSVPKLELRSQLDLDFLVASSSAAAARKILERRGYRLHAISGRSWEFHTSQTGEMSLKDIYKATHRRTVELHLEPVSLICDSLLERVQWCCFRGEPMPVLDPVDLFLGQGMHLFKHVCSPFMRTAHIIEFRRNVLARHHDDAFWKRVQMLAERNSIASIGLGTVTLLISNAMGRFAPEALTSWSMDRLPEAVRLWVSRYGFDAIYGDFPGSKLYLLLQRELEGMGPPPQQSVRRALLPLYLPKAISHRTPNEDLSARIRRYRKQLWFASFRLRFHIVEGVRYLCESLRWRRLLRSAERSGLSAGPPKGCGEGCR